MRLHKCAANGCAKQIYPRFLMCAACWSRVPNAVQVEIYAAWNHGRGLGSDEHNLAVAKAVELVSPRALPAAVLPGPNWARRYRVRA